MGVQVPEGALGTVIGVLIFSLICLTCSLLMIWLVWTHHERDSFVGLLSYFTFISTLASIIQQLHTIIWWTDVKTEQWENSKAHIGSVEVAIAGPSVGIDLVLFYIQYYAYNVEALLSLCWAAALAQSIFGFADIASFKRIRHRTNSIIKIIAVVLPAILISLLRVPTVRNSFAAFIIVANVNMLISLTLGALLLLTILGKYIYTRRQFLSWNVQYGNSTRSGTQSQTTLPNSRNSQGNINRRGHGIYDRWLMTRFAITFIMLSIFELFLILFQVSSTRTTIPPDAPNLSASRAKGDFILFMPGCLPSVLLFVVFGTTAPFREHMRKTFLPKRFHKKESEDSGTQMTAYPSQRRKLTHTSVITEEVPPTPTEDGNIIHSREVDQRASICRGDEDEWPILSTTKRGNGAMV
ncbi:hypothetical protein BKA67DRAFT_553082 [Truncatella angustata]|uniref:Glycoside hydrolase n=1 Tax=Truncatella angustata TaxID=152316 RepID=A0A9P8UR86_9PEZI|nr:uncharacterized protein BKA67DRAFT_553082 [Truncatella angustata]KAH6656783.1 hypothetical protein BKA67DRAFT_553082 [Truncatella angustata]